MNSLSLCTYGVFQCVKSETVHTMQVQAHPPSLPSAICCIQMPKYNYTLTSCINFIFIGFLPPSPPPQTQTHRDQGRES